jgi:hypothetical protein
MDPPSRELYPGIYPDFLFLARIAVQKWTSEDAVCAVAACDYLRQRVAPGWLCRPGRFPLVLMAHGTPSVEGEAFFCELTRRSAIADRLQHRGGCFRPAGYAAVAITRRGFGRSGGAYSGGFSESLRLPSRRPHFRRGCHGGSYFVAEGVLGRSRPCCAAWSLHWRACRDRGGSGKAAGRSGHPEF